MSESDGALCFAGLLLPPQVSELDSLTESKRHASCPFPPPFLCLAHSGVQALTTSQ